MGTYYKALNLARGEYLDVAAFGFNCKWRELVELAARKVWPGEDKDVEIIDDHHQHDIFYELEPDDDDGEPRAFTPYPSRRPGPVALANVSCLIQAAVDELAAAEAAEVLAADPNPTPSEIADLWGLGETYRRVLAKFECAECGHEHGIEACLHPIWLSIDFATGDRGRVSLVCPCPANWAKGR